MPKKRTSMDKIKEVLRLKYECQLSLRKIASCTKVSRSTISEILTRFEHYGVGWPLPDNHSEAQLAQVLYRDKTTSASKVMPNFSYIHKELRRPPMTKQLLWEEYVAEHHERAYRYSQYCEHYRRWLKKQKRSMRQSHLAGDKLFIDYCGPTIPVINPETGEVRKAQIFVATLSASNYTYVEACESQRLEHWLEAHANAFEHFGGVPALLVPDNLKAAVTKTDRYEPQLNDSYRQLAHHYQTAVMPARPYKPKDKAKAENAVLIVERWIMMRLRNEVFHTFRELNLAIKELMQSLNQRRMKELDASRVELFNTLDKPALRPLSAERFLYTEFKQAKVGPDYHIEYKQHYYSVPHQLVGQHVQLEASRQLVRIYHQGQCVAQHPANAKMRGQSTYTEHMPSNHQYQKWSPERLQSWAARIGPATKEVISHQLQSKDHPAQATRSCLGLLNLSTKHSDQRLEQACKDALIVNKPYLRFIKNLLQNHREGRLSTSPELTPDIQHSNVRGPESYH
ncbi:TPA: IS21 family transposase [Vibrio vulnificus]|uniref:IS21 family transposase n=1 Tax=Vibrio vulnificus TaxID=672 RepID=UPI001022A71F|nr:IS21 family transposase [Vibrio vulnificus]EKY4883164.1 IS21 family transposase [Vibrio vulnificus]ELY1394163.1 IS21 family transposase [Vibrio vulnificus]RZQ19216.1 IS21 family transposase [Vibrio vulnificus]WNJ69063.1 IS21 family transposase [Vibrio vulnificus]HAS6097557.1 IS21 family transposase [Vibrio vulnificus]